MPYPIRTEGHPTPITMKDHSTTTENHSITRRGYPSTRENYSITTERHPITRDGLPNQDGRTLNPNHVGEPLNHDKGVPIHEGKLLNYDGAPLNHEG